VLLAADLEAEADVEFAELPGWPVAPQRVAGDGTLTVEIPGRSAVIARLP
jgi:hypothetical protein